MNTEKQKDEILALESIYNKEEFSYCLVDNHYELTLKVFISLPENYYFTYNDDQENKEEVQKVNVSHLPPLTMCVTLPTDYPSKVAPNFILRCSWLKKNFIYKLCKQLDRLWEANDGQEILFAWITFLQSETLQFLHMEEYINMNFAYERYKKVLSMNEKKQKVDDNLKNYTSAKEVSNYSESKVEKMKSGEGQKLTIVPGNRDKKLPSRKKHGKTNGAKILERRAMFDVPYCTNPIKLLIDYNKMRNDIEFKKNFCACKICFMDKLGEHCIQFSPCLHVFCRDCITEYFVSKIRDGSVLNIRCPDDGCSSEASSNQIKDLVSPELFSQYDSLLLNITLDTMTDIIYCPRKFCQYPVSREQNEIMASCPMCEFTFCIFCKAVYHGVAPCKMISAEKRNLVKEYQEASASKKIELEQRYGKKQLQTVVENCMSETWIEKNSQNCPKCNAAIEKSDGCNKMTCWKCNTYFCWLCKARLLQKDPYDHYNDPKSECYRRLYQGLVIDDEDDHIDDEDDFDHDDEDEEFDDFHDYFWSTDEEDELNEFLEL